MPTDSPALARLRALAEKFKDITRPMVIGVGTDDLQVWWAALQQREKEVEQWELDEEQRVGNFCARCEAGEPLRMRWGPYNQYVSHAPDSQTPGMGCYREMYYRVEALNSALQQREAALEQIETLLDGNARHELILRACREGRA